MSIEQSPMLEQARSLAQSLLGDMVHTEPVAGVPGGVGGAVTARRAMLTPGEVIDALPLTDEARGSVETGRLEVARIIRGEDDRLLVHVGPCSVHNAEMAGEYAARLAGLRQRYGKHLLIAMRVYREKPRTTTGWKGMTLDPNMDGSHDVNTGLVVGRMTMLAVARHGVPVVSEALYPNLQPFTDDLTSQGVIGARTVESQIHREMGSGAPYPMAVKNTTGGGVLEAAQALIAINSTHTYTAVGRDGRDEIVTSTGNSDTVIMLRGGDGPNYEATYVSKALSVLEEQGRPRRLMVDASHGNSGKDHARQPEVAGDLAGQIAAGNRAIVGVALEAYFKAGKQKPGPDADPRLSVTDGCMGFDTTVDVLDILADAVQQRRRMAA